MTYFYVAATNAMSWGRGTRAWEALAHAISHGGEKVDTAVIFELKCPEGTLENEITVNEMGSITGPNGTEVKELGQIDAKRLRIKFLSYKDLVDVMLDDDVGN